MKHNTLMLVTVLTLLFGACGTVKNEKGNDLFGSAWELEYITGKRIAFDGLFPDKKPRISFEKDSGKAMGNSGCNGYSSDYALDGNTLSFGDPGPTTMMYCGEGEPEFLKAIKKVNGYSFDKEGKLNLLMDDLPVLRFKKVIP
ncbi:META domain-containing protein [Sinomicrobium weinanense]|uniref:META domain-containing protein n=1 Tax=Sinomicrobium weinanense TaxID=2842200 RepID=A0A926JWF4_9FLAO|nr:META domain-containing protein [Sinomicrobium weinanense]MBC9798616.1 META domain-containing protein [Sinomicrobium weinanense]MBU3124483.1 META domain-containing protein [Sinomicrobium weinanense]